MKHDTQHQKLMQKDQYMRMVVMVMLSFVAMYILMYAMVNRLENVVPNLNEFYMAGLMAMPMLVIELALMGNMYKNKRLNLFLVAAGVIGGVAFWILIRQQAGITDRQFLKSMIPHHGGAILMCEQSKSRDPQILRLCNEIISSQRSEIAQMKSMLAARDKR